MDHPESDLTKQLDGVVADLRDRMPLMMFHPAEGKDPNHPLAGDTFIKIFDVLAKLSHRIDQVEQIVFLLHDQTQNHLALTGKMSEQVGVLSDQVLRLAQVTQNISSRLP